MTFSSLRNHIKQCNGAGWLEVDTVTMLWQYRAVLGEPECDFSLTRTPRSGRGCAKINILPARTNIYKVGATLF